MNILHIDEQDGWRGGEQQATYLMHGLARRGHTIVAAGRPGCPFLTRNQGVSGLIPFAAPLRGELDLWSAWRLAKAIKNHNIDLIHAHTSHAHTQACVARALAGRGKVIVSRRVDFRPKNNVINRWKYACPDKIVAVSRFIAGVMRSYGVPDDRVSVVHSVQDPARFEVTPLTREELGLPQNGPILGCVAALVDHKDHATLLAAMPQTLQSIPDLQLVLIGEGELRPAIVAQIRELHLQDNVTLLGYRTDVARILPLLDAFVLSSKEEGFGGVCLEAMFSNVPIVAAAAGGIPESVRNEETGLLVPIRDPEALAKAIVRLVSDPSLGASLARRANEMARREFTVDHMVEGYLKVYNSLV